MKKMVVLWTLAIGFFAWDMVLAQSPRSICGFELGRHISEYTETVKMDTALPLRYNEFLHQVEIEESPYFKSGLITFGNCKDPGRILRIKLKYADSTKKFYEKLLKRYKEHFGDPQEYRGDSFQILIAWKWSFVDGNDQISLTLQHNSKDQEEKMGNSVKMTMTNYMEEERNCYKKKHSDTNQKLQKQKMKMLKDKLNWDMLIPK